VENITTGLNILVNIYESADTTESHEIHIDEEGDRISSSPDCVDGWPEGSPVYISNCILTLGGHWDFSWESHNMILNAMTEIPDWKDYTYLMMHAIIPDRCFRFNLDQINIPEYDRDYSEIYQKEDEGKPFFFRKDNMMVVNTYEGDREPLNVEWTCIGLIIADTNECLIPDFGNFLSINIGKEVHDEPITVRQYFTDMVDGRTSPEFFDSSEEHILSLYLTEASVEEAKRSWFTRHIYTAKAKKKAFGRIYSNYIVNSYKPGGPGYLRDLRDFESFPATFPKH